MCQNCGGKDHLVKDCASVRCSNCEQPGHRAEDCEDALRFDVCKAFEHSVADCPICALALLFCLRSSLGHMGVGKNGVKRSEKT